MAKSKDGDEKPKEVSVPISSGTKVQHSANRPGKAQVNNVGDVTLKAGDGRTRDLYEQKSESDRNQNQTCDE